VAAGAVFGPSLGMVFTCLLSAIGASCCYLLARFCGGLDLAEHLAPKVLEDFGRKLKTNSNRLIYFLLSLRYL